MAYLKWILLLLCAVLLIDAFVDFTLMPKKVSLIVTALVYFISGAIIGKKYL